jgi:hypothetical protein
MKGGTGFIDPGGWGSVGVREGVRKSEVVNADGHEGAGGL